MHLNKPSRWILRQMDLLRNLDDVLVWMLYRWTCGCTWTLLTLLLLFTIDAQKMDMLMHSDTVESCCYCSLWMPQEMDLLFHMNIVNIIVTVIVICYQRL